MNNEDPRVLLALLERDIANLQAGIAALGRMTTAKGKSAAAKPVVEEDPRRAAMREKMRQRAIERWAKIREGKARAPKAKKASQK